MADRTGEDYRALAAQEREFAATTKLENVRAMHERAEAGWLRLAERADKTRG